MKDADRFRLLRTYRTPRICIGTVLSCEARDDDVMVVGYSDARTPRQSQHDEATIGVARSRVGVCEIDSTSEGISQQIRIGRGHERTPTFSER